MVKKRTPVSELPRSLFRGELSKPIELPVPRGWVVTSEEWKECRQNQLLKERQRKLPLLFEQFNLKNGDWEGLALALAYTQVPGLTWIDKPQAGAPRVWTWSMLEELAKDMEEIFVREPDCKVVDAARSLASTEKWKSRLPGRKNLTEVIRAKYFEGQRWKS